MITAGIDVGGTKIEAQIFNDSFELVSKNRCDSPNSYDALVDAIADQMRWVEAQAGERLPIGIGSAGIIDPNTGIALTANLPASGRALPKDVAEKAGRGVTFVNDCRAVALSEAVFGAGRGHSTVISLVLGTGVGGGVTIGQRLFNGPTCTGGEFGHIAAAAHVVRAHDLPLFPCGCGRIGCVETYISGPGLVRLAKHLTDAELTSSQIAARRHAETAEVWDIWCALAAELIHALTVTIDPDVIVLGGGISRIEGVADDLMKAAKARQMGSFGSPPIVIAQGGDASGARGAAYAAWQEANFQGTDA